VASIFISYRRDDASGHAGRLRDALSAHFGRETIFRDIDTIPPGDDFRRAMSAAIRSCGVFLAVIGTRWLSAEAADGTRRLDNPLDHVRTEIVEALQRGVLVIPVLVQGARMPAADDLPDSMRTLATRNAIALDDDSWEADIERLIAAIRRALDRVDAPGRTVRLPIDFATRGRGLIAGSAALFVVVLGLFLFTRTDRDSAGSGSTPPPDPPVVVPEPGNEPQGPQSPVTLLNGGEAELGEAVFEVLDAGIVSGRGGSTLVVRVRLTNHGRYDAILNASQFRLVVDGRGSAPASTLGELVPAETSKDGSLMFPVAAGIEGGRLQIAAGDERAEIELDFTARRGVRATQDREARRAGKTTTDLPLDAANRELKLGDLICELRSATLRRYVNKQTLTVGIRAQNRGRYDAAFGGSQFRLILDGNGIAPANFLSTVVPADTSRDGTLVFDRPLDAKSVLLRGRQGDVTATIPLQLPTRMP
jgi:hypothetical protein